MPDSSHQIQAPGPPAGEVMIRASGLGKKFKIYPRPSGRVVEWLTLGRAVRHDDFWALRDVSFEVRRGECLGVIGVNGSGKSTLLKILSGAMYPTAGEFAVSGRVLSLLELGTGLNPDLTGRQNVVHSARLLALPPAYAAERMPAVEAFAELGEFFDRPIRLYSSGMLVRLVFSMFASFDPEVFVVDEALSVGDIYFQQKCADRIRRMKAAGVTMLFVSHDLMAVESLCDRVLLLHAGRPRYLGDKAAGIRQYYALSGAGGAGGQGNKEPEQAPATAPPVTPSPPHPLTPSPPSPAEPTPPMPDDTALQSLPWQPPDERERIGDGRVRIAGICWQRPADGGHEPVVEQNAWLELFVRLEAVADAGPLNCGITLLDRMHRLLWARGWINADVPPLTLRAGQQLIARFRIRLDLEPGEYTVNIAASEAWADSNSPNGWNQDFGGERYAELPYATKLAVFPRRDRRKLNYGPSSLPSELGYVVVPGDAGAGSGA